MARGVNKAIIIGNLGKDPETRYTASNNAITNITVATNESWKDKQSGEMQERTEWHRVVFFNRLAEIASEYLRKGSTVYVEGRIQTRKWQGQDGQDRYTTEIVSNQMHSLGGRGGAGRAAARSRGATAPARRRQPGRASSNSAPRRTAPSRPTCPASAVPWAPRGRRAPMRSRAAGFCCSTPTPVPAASTGCG